MGEASHAVRYSTAVFGVVSVTREPRKSATASAPMEGFICRKSPRAAEARGVDAVLAGIGANEAHGPLCVLDLGGIAEGGRSTVGDGEHRVARLRERWHVHPNLLGFLQGRCGITDRSG